MPNVSAKILLVEDEPSIQLSMSAVLSEAGYIVQLAEDGFSALRGIRQEMPDILLSDLNMPGMSGFELLSVVRRRFPAILTVAMSGAYAQNEVPFGIAADGFYSKGGGVAVLLQVLYTLSHAEPCIPHASSTMAPLWIHRNRDESSLDTSVTIACPECLRTFAQSLHGSVDQVQVTKCTYCDTMIHFSMVKSVDRQPLSAFRQASTEIERTPVAAAQYYY
jgi:CheY-like chemotaxis protein